MSRRVSTVERVDRAAAHDGILQADEVFPDLWQAGAQRSEAAVAAAGFGAVVFAAEELQPHVELVEAIRCPIADDPFHALSPRDELLVHRAAHRAAQLVYGGTPVLVTCAAGLNRSGLISSLVLFQLGIPMDQAIACVRRARGRMALSNPQFVRLLRQISKR